MSWSVPMLASKRASMTSEQANGKSENTNAARRGAVTGSAGRKSRRSPRTSGDQRMSERIMSCRLDSPEEVVAHDGEGPDDHPERIVLDVPGLDAPPHQRR